MKGFTLIELLIALLIAMIIMLLTGTALHRFLLTHDTILDQSAKLRDLQITFFQLSHDLREIPAKTIVLGDATHFQFTRARPMETITPKQSNLFEEAQYLFQDEALFFKTTTEQTKLLDVKQGYFEFLGADGIFYRKWPPQKTPSNTLPRGVRITITLNQQGTLQKLYALDTATPLF